MTSDPKNSSTVTTVVRYAVPSELRSRYSLASLWHMIARSAYVQLRYNPLLLAGTIAGLLLLYVAPPAGLIGAVIASAAGHGGAASGIAGVAGLDGWVFMTLSYVPMLRYYRQPLWLAPVLPFTAFLYLLMTVDSAVQHYRGRGAAWKGRTYARPDAVADEHPL